MDLQRKHSENLKRYRIVRREREGYVRNLEVKAHNFEKLYADTQKDIKILREKLTLLEGKLIKAQKIHNINNVSYLKFEGHNNDDSFGNVVISNGTFSYTFTIIYLVISLNNAFILSLLIGLSASNNHGEENNDATV